MMKVHSSCVAFPLWADKRGLQQGNKNKTFHLLHHKSSSVQDKELFLPLLISTPRLSQILPPLILFNSPFLYTPRDAELLPWSVLWSRARCRPSGPCRCCSATACSRRCSRCPRARSPRWCSHSDPRPNRLRSADSWCHTWKGRDEAFIKWQKCTDWDWGVEVREGRVKWGSGKDVRYKGSGATGNLTITTRRLKPKPFFFLIQSPAKQLTLLYVWHAMPAQPVASFSRHGRREAPPDLCLTDEMTRLPSPAVTSCLLGRGEMKVAATTDSPPNLFQSEPITSPLIEICAPKCACETCVPMARRAGRCRTTRLRPLPVSWTLNF